MRNGIDLVGAFDACLVEGDVVGFAAFVGGDEPADGVDDAGFVVEFADD